MIGARPAPVPAAEPPYPRGPAASTWSPRRRTRRAAAAARGTVRPPPRTHPRAAGPPCRGRRGPTPRRRRTAARSTRRGAGPRGSRWRRPAPAPAGWRSCPGRPARRPAGPPGGSRARSPPGGRTRTRGRAERRSAPPSTRLRPARGTAAPARWPAGHCRRGSPPPPAGSRPASQAARRRRGRRATGVRDASWDSSSIRDGHVHTVQAGRLADGDLAPPLAIAPPRLDVVGPRREPGEHERAVGVGIGLMELSLVIVTGAGHQRRARDRVADDVEHPSPGPGAGLQPEVASSRPPELGGEADRRVPVSLHLDRVGPRRDLQPVAPQADGLRLVDGGIVRA